MGAPGSDPARRPWVSASELAEYAYCPRAWYYRSHPPPGGRTAAGRRSAAAGEAYHGRTLDAEWARERSGAAYAYLLLAGLAVVIVGVVWILF